MNLRQQKLMLHRRRAQALEPLGGEPLQGSGFEEETPDPEFSGCAPEAPELPPAPEP